jgi:hypothetical protein
MLDIAPIAQSTIFASLSDPLLILDIDERLVGLQPGGSSHPEAEKTPLACPSTRPWQNGRCWSKRCSGDRQTTLIGSMSVPGG